LGGAGVERERELEMHASRRTRGRTANRTLPVRQESLEKEEATKERRNLLWDPAGGNPRPATLARQPEASLAW
jgi:hypothetical protein